jgi:CBS domain-containing protein
MRRAEDEDRDGSRTTDPAAPMAAAAPMAVVADLVLTDVVVVSPRASVVEVAELLERAHVSGAPVVDGEHLVGVVTMGDLRRWLSARGPEELDPVAAARWNGPGSLHGTRLADLLSRRPVVARADWPLARAAELLESTGLRRLPVLDRDGRLVGVLARDVLAALGAIGDRPPG